MIIHLTDKYITFSSAILNVHIFILHFYTYFQVCYIMMTVENLDRKTMKLIPKELNLLQNVDMTLFYIEWWDLDFADKTDDEQGIWMSISLKRKIMSEMMTTYLPSLLLMLITFATTFFKPIYFEAALTVNLTNMLVMTTIFISVMERLPTTSYLKMVDFWLIFCQLVPFTEVRLFFNLYLPLHTSFHLEYFKVILLTAIESLREDKSDTTDTASKCSTPISESLDVASVETAEAWSEHKDVKSGYQWISGLKMLGR